MSDLAKSDSVKTGRPTLPGGDSGASSPSPSCADQDAAVAPAGEGAPDSPPAAGVLDRAAQLLDVLSANGALRLRSIAVQTGIPRPSAHRLLVSLERHGMVARDASGAWMTGPRIAAWGVRAADPRGLLAKAAQVLGHASAETGESAQLYVRVGDQRLCAAVSERASGLRDTVPVGTLLPLTAGSGGKVLLAWAADAARFGVAPQELAAIRARGLAETVAEREPGVASVSAPVWRDGHVVAAVCVSGPAARLGPQPAQLHGTATQAAARALGDGGSDDRA